MTAPDLPLPGDWSPRRLLGVAVAGWSVLLLVAVRQRWFWGGQWGELLHVAAAGGLLLFTLLAGAAMAQAVRQASSLPRGFLLGGGALLALLAAAAPPFLSSDLFDYLSRGRLEHLGLNPYTHVVDEVAADPQMAPFAARSEWTHWPMPYGPLMGTLQWLLTCVDTPWLSALLWKLLAAAAHFGCGLAFAQLLARDGGPRAAHRGLALWLWNPLPLLEGVASGHNDVLVALLLLLTAAAAARDRFAPAALAFGAAVLIKHGVSPIAPLLLVLAFCRGRWRSFLLGTGGVLLLLALLWLRYFRDPGALDFVLRQAEVARASLPVLLRLAFGAAAAAAGTGLGLLLALAVLAGGIVRIVRGAGLRAFGGHALLVLVLLLLLSAPQFAPWYHLWWLPLVALVPVPPALRTMELLGWLVPLSYLVWVGTRSFGLAHQAWQFALAAAWPAALLLLEWRAVLGVGPRPQLADLPTAAGVEHR